MSIAPWTLEGKHLLVTGASSGIGRRTAISISEMGGTLLITGRDKERLGITYSALNGGSHEYYCGDLTQQDDLQNLVGHCRKVSGVVNCAGYGKYVPIKYANLESIRTFEKINYEMPVLLIRELLKSNKIETGGSIVLITSIMSVIGIRANSLYAGSKGGLVAFSKSLALELAPKKIRVNCISPALVETPLLDAGSDKGGVSGEDYERDIKKHPLGIGRPEDIARAVLFLLSDVSRWITGTNLIVDGGYSAQ